MSFSIVSGARRAVIVDIKDPSAFGHYSEEEAPDAPGTPGRSPQRMCRLHVVFHAPPAFEAAPFRKNVFHPEWLPAPGKTVRAGRRFFAHRRLIESDLDLLIEKTPGCRLHAFILSQAPGPVLLAEPRPVEGGK